MLKDTPSYLHFWWCRMADVRWQFPLKQLPICGHKFYYIYNIYIIYIVTNNCTFISLHRAMVLRLNCHLPSVPIDIF